MILTKKLRISMMKWIYTIHKKSVCYTKWEGHYFDFFIILTSLSLYSWSRVRNPEPWQVIGPNHRVKVILFWISSLTCDKFEFQD